MQNIVDYCSINFDYASAKIARRDCIARLQNICGIKVPDDEREPA